MAATAAHTPDLPPEGPAVPDPAVAEIKLILSQLVIDARNDARATAERFGEIKGTLKTLGDYSVETREAVSKLETRVRSLETTVPKASETARQAMQSFSDLGERVTQTEAATMQAVKAVSLNVGQVAARVDEMDKEQTPILHQIRDEQNERKIREKVLAEELAAREKKANQDRLDRDAIAAAKIAESNRVHERRLKYLGAGVALITALGTAMTGYLGAKTAFSEKLSTSPNLGHHAPAIGAP